MLRILFVVPNTPNPVNVRPYNLIRSLAGRGHAVTVLTLFRNEAEQADAARLAACCDEVIALPLPQWRGLWNALRALPTRRPLQAGYAWQPALAEQLERLFDGGRGNGRSPFDIIHVEHLRGAGYGLYIKRLHAPRGEQPPPIIWDSVDCISLLFSRAAVQSRGSLFGRWMTRFDVERTRRHEPWLARQFDHVLMTSPADRAALAALLAGSNNGQPAPPISVVPNGVDLQHFSPASEQGRDRASIVVSGKMSYHANVTMTLSLAHEIMPLVWASRPDVQLVIAGKDPARPIRALTNEPRVTVTGTVPDLAPYLQRATLAAAPLAYGVGIQNKVLEAMACATPVVVTPQGASALQAVPGRDLLVAGEPAEFAATVLRLLDDPTQRGSVGAAGRAYVEGQHDWTAIGARLEAIYEAALSDHSCDR